MALTLSSLADCKRERLAWRSLRRSGGRSDAARDDYRFDAVAAPSKPPTLAPAARLSEPRLRPPNDSATAAQSRAPRGASSIRGEASVSAAATALAEKSSCPSVRHEQRHSSHWHACATARRVGTAVGRIDHVSLLLPTRLDIPLAAPDRINGGVAFAWRKHSRARRAGRALGTNPRRQSAHIALTRHCCSCQRAERSGPPSMWAGITRRARKAARLEAGKALRGPNGRSSLVRPPSASLIVLTPYISA